MIVLAHDRKLSVGELPDAMINVLSVSLPDLAFRTMLAHAVFEKGLREWLAFRAAARIPTARDWARRSFS